MCLDTMPRRYLVLWISFLLQREREVSFERPSMRPKVVEPDRNTFQIERGVRFQIRLALPLSLGTKLSLVDTTTVTLILFSERRKRVVTFPWYKWQAFWP